jgi:2-C-methyl-D-erythritol 2,4-cyclodiphosphate synthase
MRIGHGIDAHRLVEGRELVLCGVHIPHEKGLLGHSDADVATHALMDALLGAAALGDIGVLFPDTEERYRGACSLELLALVVSRLEEIGYAPVNVDVTIIAQRPKLRPYIEEMRKRLSEKLTLPIGCVSVKATTTEGLGPEGEERGISAHAVCLLRTLDGGARA